MSRAVSGDATVGRWRRLVARLPMRSALVSVAAVWLLGCVWSYQEQSAFAAAKGFTFPHLLPLVIDGFAVSMAGVSWAASLDARPAVAARLATVLAVAASSASNGVWAWLRTHHDPVTVVVGVAVPIAANLAFEVLLAELRRQVQRRRGLPAPVAVPYPRFIRIALAPVSTLRDWRVLVLHLTDLTTPDAEPLAPAPGATSDDRAGALARDQTHPPAPTPIPHAAPDEPLTSARPPVRGDLTERARRVVTTSPAIGRRRLARELEVSEHTARQLLVQLDQPNEPARGADDQLVPLFAVNGAPHD